jgi:hypothetical protein
MIVSFGKKGFGKNFFSESRLYSFIAPSSDRARVETMDFLIQVDEPL